jgi:hypothetical protein
MDWDKILKAAQIPMIVLLILQMISFVTLVHQSSYYSYLFLPVILLSYILPAFIYLYTGYSGVKNYNLKLGEAALTGALMSAALTVISTIVTIGTSYSATYLASSSIIILAFSVFGLVTSAIFNGFLALIGGLIAQWLTKKIQVKRNHLLLLGGLLLAVVLFFVLIIVLFYLNTGPGPRVSSCSVQTPGFVCYAYKLASNTSLGESGLILDLGQATGHDIKITGVNCTTSETWVVTDFSPAVNITILTGTHKMLNGTAVTPAPFQCWKSDGTIIGPSDAGAAYSGKIYIHYLDLETNTDHKITGYISGRVE